MALVPRQRGVEAEEGHGGASGGGRGDIQLASVVTLGREADGRARRQDGGGRMGATRHAKLLLLLLLLLDGRRASGRAGDGNGGGEVS